MRPRLQEVAFLFESYLRTYLDPECSLLRCLGGAWILGLSVWEQLRQRLADQLPPVPYFPANCSQLALGEGILVAKPQTRRPGRHSRLRGKTLKSHQPLE